MTEHLNGTAMREAAANQQGQLQKRLERLVPSMFHTHPHWEDHGVYVVVVCSCTMEHRELVIIGNDAPVEHMEAWAINHIGTCPIATKSTSCQRAKKTPEPATAKPMAGGHPEKG